MGIFDRSNSDQIKYLEEERVMLWERVSQLEKKTESLQNEIHTRTPESEKEAKQHSRKAAEYHNKTKERLEEAKIIVSQLSEELEAIREYKDEVGENSQLVSQQKLAVDEVKSRLDEKEIEYQKKLDVLDSKIQTIEAVLEKYPDLDSKIKEIDEFIEEVEANHEKSQLTLTNINNRKKEVDKLYREIFGYTNKNEETGEESKVEGLKDELDSTYGELDEKLKEAFEHVEGLKSNYEDSYEKFVVEYREHYSAINQEIQDLLPGAMTAGLSSAFSTKKTEEETSSKKHQRNFSIGIGLMILVSVLPVSLSIHFLNTGETLETIIGRIPRVVSAIIPLYIPILWFTYSANKKLNLSKRLIEEYAHKEVLSRTYQGLSEQIASIKDKDQSEELKARLLANFLQVTAENPGKLISNYEASDHPVMEALEQTYKFQLAIDRLEGIPGMGKVVAFMEKSSKRKVNDKKEKIEKALADNIIIKGAEPLNVEEELEE